jgi:hypothetical protein
MPTNVASKMATAMGIPIDLGSPTDSAYHGTLLPVTIRRFGRMKLDDAMLAHPLGQMMPRSRAIVAEKMATGEEARVAPAARLRFV